jgi:hypothetical protein
MTTKKLKGVFESADLGTYWKNRISALVGTDFEIDNNNNCLSKKDNEYYPPTWLVFETDLQTMINQRNDISGQIEELDSQRYYQEVKNDVMNLNDVDKAQLGEWLNDHLDIEIVRERNFDRD